MVRDASYCCGLAFLLKSFGGVMSCLFRSFRLSRQSSPHSRSGSAPSNTTTNSKKDRALRSKNSLADLFGSQRDDGGSPSKELEDGGVDPISQADVNSELRDEAKFLKSCGTLLETPLEIRKTSKKVKDSLHTEDTETSKFHSWLPTKSMEKLNNEVQVNQLSKYYVKFCNDPGKESISPSSPGMLSVTNQCKHRSVHFEVDSDRTSAPSCGVSTKKSDSPGSCNQVKHFPYPTPLKLNDEMQTPGTVYPINSHAEKARIRSQYVYNVLNPVQDFSQLMALKEVDYNNHKQVDSSTESPGRTADACSGNSNVSNRGKENSSVKEGLDASLSHWLKHSSKNDGVQNCQSASSGGSNSCKTSDMDRPILGTVAAHWNADESSHISPKWWDGNGIPNSTNKYKEDQKVSWHAIPFEKRLEEALSNESFVSQRKLSPEPVEFVGNEKSDMKGLKTS